MRRRPAGTELGLGHAVRPGVGMTVPLDLPSAAQTSVCRSGGPVRQSASHDATATGAGLICDRGPRGGAVGSRLHGEGFALLLCVPEDAWKHRISFTNQIREVSEARASLEK